METDSDTVNQAMEYCFANKIINASDFRSIVSAQQQPQIKQAKVVRLNPLSGQLPEKANIQPQRSSIDDFEAILKKS